MHDARLRFEMPDLQTAEAVAAALAPEVDDGPPGTTTRLTVEGHAIAIHIEAADLSGLRAAIQGIVRLLDAAHRVTE